MSMDASSPAVRMDRMYRCQRHIYDLTRKFYLLGRDRLIAELGAAPGTRVLEIGCGTGRNLILAAQRYPRARFFGIDASDEMLDTARRAVARAGLSARIALAQGDATAFDARALFGAADFERIFISYTLSMIPPWHEALDCALAALATGGTLHIVDFGTQDGWPAWFRGGLRRWLRMFGVEPRAGLASELAARADARRATLTVERLYGDYAQIARLTLPVVAQPWASLSPRITAIAAPVMRLDPISGQSTIARP